MAESGIDGAKNLFIRRWGEMAATWGISRTMAEIHAMLYLSPEPVCTDDVMDQLEVSRGSASTNLRQLLNWGLIQREHRRGDRKEYFEAEKDVWLMFETIIRERRRRELQPIVETLERCVELASEGPRSKSDTVTKAYTKRFSDILDLCNAMNAVFNVVNKAGRRGLKPLTKALSVLAK